MVMAMSAVVLFAVLASTDAAAQPADHVLE
jgi:hypothetical protein